MRARDAFATVSVVAVAAVFVARAGLAGAFPAVDEHTPGVMAMSWDKNTQVYGSLEAGFVDGTVTASPSNAETADRRIETRGDAVADMAFGGRFGLRASVRAVVTKRRAAQDDSGGGGATQDTSSTEAEPALDLSFVTDKGLELFVGAGVHRWEESKIDTTTPAGTSHSKAAAATVQTRRAGIVRRGGAANGGLYYVQGGQTERVVSSDVYDGSEVEATDVVFIPSRFGLFGRTNGGGSLNWDFGADFVQARGLGPKDDAEQTPYGDWFEGRVAGIWSAGGVGWKLGAFHRTMAYAKSSFITLDTIPVTGITAAVIGGDDVRGAYVGVTAARGTDGQSLPEFNAKYDVKALAITAGIGTGF